jgi:hypothetical protein
MGAEGDGHSRRRHDRPGRSRGLGKVRETAAITADANNLFDQEKCKGEFSQKKGR